MIIPLEVVAIGGWVAGFIFGFQLGAIIKEGKMNKVAEKKEVDQFLNP